MNYYCSSPPTDLNRNNNVDGTEEMNLSGLRCLFIWHHQEKNVFGMAFWKNITYCLGGSLSKSIQKYHTNSTASAFSSYMQHMCVACHAHFFPQNPIMQNNARVFLCLHVCVTQCMHVGKHAD